MKKFVVTWTFMRHIHRQREYKILTKVIEADSRCLAEFKMNSDIEVCLLRKKAFRDKLKACTCINDYIDTECQRKIKISDMTEAEIYTAAIETFGEENQYDMLLEEMAELAQAILKVRRGPSPDRIDNLHEEFADVMIVMSQIGTLLDQKVLAHWHAVKIDRLKNKINHHKDQ